MFLARLFLMCKLFCIPETQRFFFVPLTFVNYILNTLKSTVLTIIGGASDMARKEREIKIVYKEDITSVLHYKLNK